MTIDPKDVPDKFMDDFRAAQAKAEGLPSKEERYAKKIVEPVEVVAEKYGLTVAQLSQEEWVMKTKHDPKLIGSLAKELVDLAGGPEAFLKMCEADKQALINAPDGKMVTCEEPSGVVRMRNGWELHFFSKIKDTTATMTFIDEPMEPQETWRDRPSLL